MTREQIANFITTDSDSQVVCQPDTQLFYMYDQWSTRRGKHLCADCHQHHVQKTDSIHHTKGVDKRNVHRNVAAAQ